MSDIDRLTLVVGCLGMLTLHKMPETSRYTNWSFLRLTIDLVISGVFIAGVLYPMLSIVFK
jgi:hypothetical protein